MHISRYDYKGEMSEFTFFAKSDSLHEFFFVSEELDSDLSWLESKYPEEYKNVIQLFNKMDIDRNSIKENSSIIYRGNYP